MSSCIGVVEKDAPSRPAIAMARPTSIAGRRRVGYAMESDMVGNARM